MSGGKTDHMIKEESERRFRLMADSAPVMLWMAGIDKMCNYFNQPWLDFTGKNLEQEVGDGWARGVHPEDFDACWKTYESAFDDRRSFRMEYRLKRFDGEYRWILDTGTPRFDEDGRFTGYIGSCIDINDQKRIANNLELCVNERTAELGKANLELHAARDEAMKASRIKSEFLANMSHEIRTPLSAVIGMSELLNQTTLTKDQRELTSIIQSSAESLLGIINDILDYSKLEAGKVVLESIEFDPVWVVEGVAELLSERVRQKNLSLMTFISPGIPKVLRGDPGRLRQILLNLAGNATKFTESGEVIIQAELMSKDEHQALLRFDVIDTGIGVEPESMDRLFQQFTQLDGSMSRRYGGTGLGLSISKQLVERMGGQIGVESEKDKGSRFWFTVPFPHGGVGEHKTLPQNFAQKKVLIAGGSHGSRNAIRAYATSWGLWASEINTLADVLPLMESEKKAEIPFDLVIVQCNELNEEVIAFARSLKQKSDFIFIPIVLISIFHQPGSGEKAINGGFSAYLTKPLKQAKLFECIASMLNAAKQTIIDTREPTNKDIALLAQTKPGSKHVLVVEDDPIGQKVAQLMLESLGCTVHLVQNGEEAVAASGRTRYDLILMDCQMPQMDGLQATNIIRQTESFTGHHTPIVAMTARAMPGDREECLAAGMDNYMSKPMSISKLVEILKGIEAKVSD